MVTSPSVWLITPQRIFMVVDLPAPLEPSSPMIPWEGISKLISRIAQSRVYRWERCSIFAITGFILIFGLQLFSFSSDDGDRTPQGQQQGQHEYGGRADHLHLAFAEQEPV